MCFVVAMCSAATTKAPKDAKKKDVKEKRDAVVTPSPYSYDTPQKSFQIPYQIQKELEADYQKGYQIEYQKAAPIEHHQGQHQNEYHQQKLESPINVQQHQQAYEYPQNFGYATAVESLYGEQPYKGFNEYSYSYPGLEAFGQMPIVHYNTDSNKVNSAVVSLHEQKAPSYTSYKSYQPSYSHASPSPAYSFPAHSYAAPQQQLNTYVHSYAPSAHSRPSESYYSQDSHDFNQSPAAIFVPQSISVGAKPTKVPDYASGLKGLGHFSTIASVAAPISASTPSSVYHKQNYEIPAYYQQYSSQTERPFKASTYLGSSHIAQDLYSEQSISNNKPSGEYLPPSKQYLPAKEQYAPAREQYAPQKHHYVSVKEQYVPAKEQHYFTEQSPVEYQIQYVKAPAKQYVAPSVKTQYLPPKHISVQVQEPQKTYLPSKNSYVAPKNTYLPPSQPTNNYLPPNNPFHQTASYYPVPQQQQQHQYQHQIQQESYESPEYHQSSSQSGH